jgi:hypothetical protein
VKSGDLEWLRGALARLSKRRPLFHSEADFQHELAWELRQAASVEDIRIERPFAEGGSRRALDLALRLRGEWFGLELKYLSRRLQHVIDGEAFDLANQAAQDIRRYDYWKDVARLEEWTRGGRLQAGAAILLTNDPNFWTGGRKGVVDEQFRTHDGRSALGSLRWSTKASRGTTAGRDNPIVLAGKYHVSWAAFSRVGSGPASVFKYLLVPVGGH